MEKKPDEAVAVPAVTDGPGPKRRRRHSAPEKHRLGRSLAGKDSWEDSSTGSCAGDAGGGERPAMAREEWLCPRPVASSGEAGG
jgi:hypothetical protein